MNGQHERREKVRFPRVLTAYRAKVIGGHSSGGKNLSKRRVWWERQGKAVSPD